MELKIKETYHGFTLNKIEELADCAGTLYEFEHLKTGAQLIWLKRDDTNKTFAITFKTLPSDDTGVFHMLEHSVLNGSKKYPLREPFVELLKSSMQTFLNAFTAPDKTMYPVSSRNDHDFMNLMSVYLDAVFNPAIYTNPNIFYQEGWHYEIRDEKDMPVYKGVVLNEMKGAFSSVDETIIDELDRMLFPDNCYQYVSGGDPKHITDLTYEQFLAAHKKFYHPGNARVWLDGDLDLDKALAFINDQYFSHYEKEEMNFDIPDQKPVPAAVHTYEYEIAEGEQKEQRTQIALAKIVSSYADSKKSLAWAALTTVLVDSNESPLRKNIIDAGLGENVEFDIYDGIQQPWAVLTIRNTDADQYDKVREVLRKTAETLVAEGIDHDDLYATLNIMEFKYREKHEPAGLMYGERAMNAWLYGGDPALYLKRGSLFEELRQEINTGYFENLLKEFLLKEDDLQAVIAVPSEEAGRRREAEEQEKLVKAKASWTDVSRYVELNKKLDAWQAASDTPEQLRTLPKLSLSDINPKPEKFACEEKEIRGVPALIYPAEDNGIVYANLYFNLAGVRREQLPELGFWSSLLMNLPTEKHTVQQLQALAKKDLGSLNFWVDAYSPDGRNDCATPLLGVSFSALQQNIEKAVPLIEEILYETKYEKETILPLLKQDNEDFRQSLIASGQAAAMRRVSAHNSAEGVFREYVGGYASNVYEVDLEKHFDEKAEDFIDACMMYSDILFAKDRLVFSVTGKENVSVMEKIMDFLHTIPANRANVHYPLLTGKRESITIPAGIAYSAVGINLGQFDWDFDASIMAASHILTYDWLWNEVRVKGGAYGTGFSVNLNRNASAYSYRDPDPMNAIRAAREAGRWLQKADDLDLEQMIIGTIAAAEPLLSPYNRMRTNDACYFKGITYEDRCNNRTRILHATMDDMRRIGKVLEEAFRDPYICVVGGQDKIEACKDLHLEPIDHK